MVDTGYYMCMYAAISHNLIYTMRRLHGSRNPGVTFHVFRDIYGMMKEGEKVGYPEA